MDAATITAISTLRSNLQDLIPTKALVKTEKKLRDDLYLLMWLRVHKMNVLKTAVAIREAFAFYEKVNLEVTVSSTPQRLIDLMSIFVDGVSIKDGLSLSYVRGDAFNATRILREFTRQELESYALWVLLEGEDLMLSLLHEKFRSDPQAAVDSIRTFVVIGDCYGLSFKHLPNIKDLTISIQMFLQIAKNAVHFPFRAREAYVVGANKVFFHLLKPFVQLQSRLGVTLRIYGTDEMEWEKEVYQHMSPEELTAYRRRAEVIMKRANNIE